MMVTRQDIADIADMRALERREAHERADAQTRDRNLCMLVWLVFWHAAFCPVYKFLNEP